MNMSANKITSNNLSAVRDLVALTGIDGEWREMGNHCQFRAVSGAILNYWKSTGTVNFQGPSLAAEEFKSMFFSYHQAAAEGSRLQRCLKGIMRAARDQRPISP
jgi:hypothetical protein